MWSHDRASGVAPPDCLPSPRGGHPSSQTASAAARLAGFARLAGTRRGLVGSARVLAAAALLALFGALALPAMAQAQTTDHFYLWTSTMTVGKSSTGTLGYLKDSYGSLSTGTDFYYPPFSPPPKHNFDPESSLTVIGLSLIENSDTLLKFLTLYTQTLLSESAATGNVTLWIRNTGFPLAEGAGTPGVYGIGSTTGYDLTVPDMDWAEGDLVRVALTYERTLPSAPTNVRVTAPRGENGTLKVDWNKAVAGTFPIEYYLVEFRPGGDARRAVQSYVPSTRTSVLRTDLEPDVAYQVFVQALSGDGHGTQSETKTRVANAGRALRARFMSPPERHDGSGRVKLRVAFSEAIDESPENVGEHGVKVEGGRVTSVRQVDNRPGGGAGARSGGGQEDGERVWEFEIEPGSDDDLTMRIDGGRPCDEPGAICTEDGRSLSEGIATTVEGPVDEAAPAALTASFVEAPHEHDGKTAFKLRIAFSEGIAISFRTFRDHSVSVSGGGVTKAKRVDRRKDLWDVTVKPGSRGDVTVTLEGGRACGTAGAVCTGDGRALSAGISTTVLGPAALTVADARVDEAADAVLDFAVTLSRASSGTVAVAYATADGSATAGSDYTATAGTLTFAPGETAKTVTVPVLDDAHDEGEETLTLRLSAATGAVLADGVATGTIKNTDHLQRAWLARFGRTAATHVTDAVGDRLRGTPGQGSHLTVGGYRLPLGQRGATDGADDGVSGVERLVLALGQRLGLGTGTAPAGAGGVAGAGGWPDAPVATDPRLGQSRTLDVGHAVNLRQVLLGSSFRLAFGRDDAGASSLRLTAWGRVAGTTFDGREGDLSLDGDVLTGTVGVDGEWDRLLAGLAVAHSRGDGSFSMPGTDARGRGGLESTLTSVHPYLRYAVTDRLAVWGLLGFGTGQMEMELDTGETRETDMDLVMGAFGGRGILLAAAESGGFQLATRTDAMLTRTTSDAVQTADGNMASGDAEAHRLRLVLEGSRGFAWAEGRRLTPTMEVGLRHDWGDAETGFGLELGGRVHYADPALGLTIDAAVRGLLAHEDSDYQEWGASGSLRLAPGARGQGLALTLAPAWGAASSGVNGLWSRQTTRAWRRILVARWRAA